MMNNAGVNEKLNNCFTTMSVDCQCIRPSEFLWKWRIVIAKAGKLSGMTIVQNLIMYSTLTFNTLLKIKF